AQSLLVRCRAGAAADDREPPAVDPGLCERANQIELSFLGNEAADLQKVLAGRKPIRLDASDRCGGRLDAVRDSKRLAIMCEDDLLDRLRDRNARVRPARAPTLA